MMTGFLVLYLNISKNTRHLRMTSWTLVLLAVVFDSFDGWMARRLGAESELGKQLDSFADFISFGIAPAAILITTETFGKSHFALLVILCYPLAGAFRLARHNILGNRAYFCGLPITAAGFMQAVFGMALGGEHIWHFVAVIILTAALSAAMVSSFKVKRIIGAKHIDKNMKSC